ncbi:hypothetical protein NL676_030348 [Syzygium grande]|nr:hypothetical protein NL676_030348 [Syzygium grande]
MIIVPGVDDVLAKILCRLGLWDLFATMVKLHGLVREAPADAIVGREGLERHAWSSLRTRRRMGLGGDSCGQCSGNTSRRPMRW